MMAKRYRKIVEYKNVDGYTNLVWQFALVIWVAFMVFFLQISIWIGIFIYALGIIHGRLTAEYKSPVRDVYYEEVK